MKIYVLPEPKSFNREDDIILSDKEKYVRLLLNIDTEKDISEFYIENEKEREKSYKATLSSRDPEQLISIIKTLYLHQEKQKEKGKKLHIADEPHSALRMADSLYREVETCMYKNMIKIYICFLNNF